MIETETQKLIREVFENVLAETPLHLVRIQRTVLGRRTQVPCERQPDVTYSYYFDYLHYWHSEDSVRHATDFNEQEWKQKACMYCVKGGNMMLKSRYSMDDMFKREIVIQEIA